jgi:hypothetical protein
VIDFRYHLVSIVAVFLALAIGIVLGSTELRGAAFSALDRTSSALSAKLNAANSENSSLQQQVNGDKAFAQAAEPVLLAHLLDGKRAVIVTAPAAPAGVVNGITTALTDAGASVSGQVALTTKFADTAGSNLSLLNQLTQQVTPSGMTLANGSPQLQAAQVLASAILSSSSAQAGSHPGGSQSGTGQSSQTAQTILQSYAQGGFLTVSGQPASGATLAVIVTPATPPTAGNSDPANQAIVSLATELGQAGDAAVVAGASAASGPGSAISAVRASGAANDASTVDDADAVSGQIVTVQALAQQVNGHKPASYGTQQGASSDGPSPAPTPSASGSTTPKTSSAKAKK